jgi:hypothetical protein
MKATWYERQGPVREVLMVGDMDTGAGRRRSTHSHRRVGN